MVSAQFKLDAFEGPLDVLLNLISLHKLNIYDIEITVLLEQYLDFIEGMDKLDYEYAAEFLEMAARLIYIKTCYLLPREEEAVQLKKELEGKLIEYSLCKKAAKSLAELYVGGDVFVRKPVKLPVNKTYTREHSVQELFDAYMGLSENARRSKPLKAEVFEPIVARKIVSVTSKITYILSKLYDCGEFEMEHLYDGMTDKSERVATFLAVLELTRSGRIYLNDDNSVIYFNKECGEGEIASSFDDEDKEDSSEHNEIDENVIEQYAVSENPETTEQDTVALDDISEINDQPVFREVSSEIKRDVPKTRKSSVKSLPERASALSCFADIKIPDKDVFVSAEIENVVYTERSVLNENSEENIHMEITSNEDTEEISEDVLNEIRLLSSLPTECPTTIFKPNYWKSSAFYWGESPVGDDKQGNYWQYGNMKIN